MRERATARPGAGTLGVAVLLAALAVGGCSSKREEEPEPETAPAEVVPAERPVAVVTFAEGCATAECHPGIVPESGAHAGGLAADCAACHEPDTGGHVYPVILEPADRCVTCHEPDDAHAFGHLRLTADGCVACHDPHSSDRVALMRTGGTGGACLSCHDLDRGRYAHEAYLEKDCTACHEPHGADNRALLRGGGGAQSCAQCHLDKASTITLDGAHHAGLPGDCLACHATHASDHEHILTGPPGDQCVTCHADVREQIEGALVSHDVVRDRTACLNCHDPHSSANPFMLRADQTELCLGCHDEKIEAADGRTIPDMASAIVGAEWKHGPVEAGRCSACHSVHGARHDRLLREIDPAVLKSPFDVRNYALCFGCHDESLILEQPTTTATAFRDGERNLHAVHLTRSGRGCADCHTIHAGHRPRLIADEVAYDRSDWMMPMGFELTEFGGGCAPGCHEAMRYDRRAELVSPEMLEGGNP